MARTSTGFGSVPVTTKPAIRVSVAVPVRLRVEMLTSFSSTARSLAPPAKVSAAPDAGVTVAVSSRLAAVTVPATRALPVVVTARVPSAATVPRPPSAVAPTMVTTIASPAGLSSARLCAEAPATPA